MHPALRWPLGLVTSKDGSLSLTKLSAATAHAFMAASFLRLQVLGGEFNETLWLVYGGFAIAHAAYDKTAAQVKAFKERQIGGGGDGAAK